MYYKNIIKDTEVRTEMMIENQVMDKSSFDYGSVQVNKEYVEAKPTIYKLSAAIAVYVNKDSKYYKNEMVFERINLGLDYVRRMQREDGTFDLLDCNFYSAPDTAFCIKRLINSYRVLDKFGFDENSKIMKDKIYVIIKDAAKGIAYGGFHTPNHRWAIASILLGCYSILNEEYLKEKADQYLNEGIDCNEDGEYAERSAAIYNVINNSAMITLYEETRNEIYIEYVKRNLEMMLTYFDPDGTIFTGNSTRQDNGKKMYPRDYFYQYLYLAQKYDNKQFKAAARKIIEDNFEIKYKKAPDCLDLLMLHENLINYELNEPAMFLNDYDRNYENSGIVRVKKQNISYTILKDNSKFLFFQKDNLQLNFKIGASYFNNRYFLVQNIEKKDNTYVLSFNARGWFYLPFEKKPDTTDWWKMDNQSREKVYKKDLNIIVSVTENDGGIDLNIKTDGCDRVPLRLEIVIPSGSIIDSKSFYIEANKGESVLIREGMFTIENGRDKLSIGPGFGTHQFIYGKSGSEPRSQENFTVYFTDFTNFDHTIHIGK